MQSIYRTLRKGSAAFKASLKRGRARKIFLRKCQERNSHIESATIYPENYDKLHIGSNVIANDAYFDTSGEITIGDATFFGWGVKVLTGTHPIYERGITRQQMSSSKDVLIGKGVWIASHAIILPGSVIGDDSVVSAGSVISGIFPPEKLIAGNPARVIKSIDFSRSTSYTNKRLEGA
jgi:acetyltransferase-like isoleucine patch superfamily enzyme